jgi:D-threo-aldose 1-dehydrogenase
VLSHNAFTLVDRSALPVLEDARARGMTVLNAAPFGGGILAGSPRHRKSYAYRPATTDLLERVARLTERCRESAVPLAAAALAFSRSHPLVDATVVGVSSLERLDQLRALAAVPLAAALLEELADVGAPAR